jgi:hypothetical protein
MPSYEDGQNPGRKRDHFAQKAAQKPDNGGNEHNGKYQIIRSCHRKNS